jgi:Xaa-Pro aminopeptidase
MTVNERIQALRSAMAAHGLDAYVIPSSDPHQSEYVADHWKSREWISGFSGSAGTVVITADHAGLWTDSRYFLIAEEQLKGSEVELHKLDIPHTPQHRDWVRENLAEGSKVGFDGRLFSVGQVRRIVKDFKGKNLELDSEADLISEIWADRPVLPTGEIFEHDVKYAGATRAEKMTSLREKMGDSSHYLISTLDDIAWLFNLRGNDVECNPVFYAFAVVGKEMAWLFVENEKVTDSLKSQLNGDGVLLKPYGALEDFLKNLSAEDKVHVDLGSTSNQVFNAIKKENLTEGKNLVQPLKAIKNPTEIEHFRQVMVKDGVALTKLFRWLEKTIEERPVPEIEVAEKLIEFRRAQGDYFGESFHAIVGYRGNGAIVHYRPEAGTCADIRPEGILLLDSGGQYLDGTTDITRTVALSTPTDEQKRDNTLVLKGHIGLALAKFPEGTTGVQLDTLARMHLWQHGLNYGHGTGHGVGFFLNVHEGPQGFSPVPHTPRANVTIDPGTLTSNEPGFYKTNEYGIRIENLVLCVEDKVGWDDKKYYRFDTLTLFPIDLNLVDEKLLTPEEKKWLNEYHEEVFEKLSPHLNEDEKAWMREKCGTV